MIELTVKPFRPGIIWEWDGVEWRPLTTILIFLILSVFFKFSLLNYSILFFFEFFHFIKVFKLVSIHCIIVFAFSSLFFILYFIYFHIFSFYVLVLHGCLIKLFKEQNLDFKKSSLIFTIIVIFICFKVLCLWEVISLPFVFLDFL